jgi:gluconokinase
MAATPSSSRPAIIVMGVSGSGKTTIGEALAGALDIAFFDGDEFHSPEARAKMTASIPLTDEDRWPWLDRIGQRLADVAAYPKGAIVACSALRRVYRDRLRAAVGPALRFVFLEGDKALMRERVAGRKGHYMPASLIDSQFATLEPPDGEGDVVALPADGEVAEMVAEAVARLRALEALPAARR